MNSPLHPTVSVPPGIFSKTEAVLSLKSNRFVLTPEPLISVTV